MALLPVLMAICGSLMEDQVRSIISPRRPVLFIGTVFLDENAILLTLITWLKGLV
jgi:hypothetical protein